MTNHPNRSRRLVIAATLQERSDIAARALDASVRFSAEILSIVSLANNGLPLSALNRTATTRTMRARIEAMVRLVELIEGEG